ncbi:ABC transporter ATP-binding protein [Nocardioides alcanivorans]|uniref:ABC transporter ATP-binding protein n=1 Tax=Nocardioides alcanivorans TaxID=2897352 RepID=UPI001F46EAD7|nr:ATP-binding cassette domain-containing protein [Nocardioides alcanivorans]
MTEPLMRVEGLRKTFKTSRWPAPPLRTVAIDDVSLEVHAGEAVGIAGESGSGKSTLISAMCGLVSPDAGRVLLHGKELHHKGRFDRRAWQQLQLVFQDPYTSLNPSMTIEENVAEPVRWWKGASRKEAIATAREMLDLVGLGSGMIARRPGQLSGGQRQRVSIARALATEPELVFLDESVSALDVSIQAQILELLLRLREERNLTYVLVSHDISVLRLVCDRVVVMQRGRVVEERPSAELTVEGVTEDYTRQLLEAVPTITPAVLH